MLVSAGKGPVSHNRRRFSLLGGWNAQLGSRIGGSDERRSTRDLSSASHCGEQSQTRAAFLTTAMAAASCGITAYMHISGM